MQEDPVLTNEDLVLGIRPEFLNITAEAPLKGEIYGAMPTGMESTIKVYVNGFLLTGVVFGSSLFTIGEQHSVSFTGHHIMLFDRQSGDCIACRRAAPLRRGGAPRSGAPAAFFFSFIRSSRRPALPFRRSDPTPWYSPQGCPPSGSPPALRRQSPPFSPRQRQSPSRCPPW